MKRYWIVALCLVGAAGVLAAASTTETAAAAEEPMPEPEGTIVLFHTYGEGSKREARNDWFETFDATFPNITLERQRLPLAKNHQKVLAAVAAGAPPDLVSNHYYYFSRYAAEGILEPLEPWFERIGVDPQEAFYPSALEIASYDATLYSVPQYIYSRALLYNRDLFRDAGIDPDRPPQTWEELVDYGRRLTVREGDDFEVAGFRAPRPDESEHMVVYFVMMLWQLGGDILSADRSEATFDSDHGVRALTYYRDLFTEAQVSTTTFGAGTKKEQKPFARGQAGMIIGGNFDLVFMRNAVADIDFGAAVLPRPEGGQSVALIDGFNLAMTAASKNKEAAWKLLEFTAGMEAQQSFAKLSSNFPALIAASADPFFTSDPALAVFAESMNGGRAIPAIPQWSEISSILENAIESVLVGGEDPAAALSAAAERVNSSIL